jgi:uncharacterized MAPEG superfamily protein
MTIDLWYLVASAFWCLLLVVPIALGRIITKGGLAWGVSNRAAAFDGDPPWVGRAERAHKNMVENLAPFTALVLVAHLAGRTGGMVPVGCAVFFWARVAHAVTYWAGIIYVRTVAFWTGVLGCLLVVYGIVG